MNNDIMYGFRALFILYFLIVAPIPTIMVCLSIFVLILIFRFALAAFGLVKELASWLYLHLSQYN